MRAMKMALLRFFARRPLTLVALGAAGVLGVVAAIGAAASCPCERGGAEEQGAPAEAQDNPRKLLGRGWFDSWPEKRRDNLRFFYFGGGGIGIYEEGSSYRYSIDVFELERQSDKVTMTFLQDQKKTETKFTITPCDEKPPFDLCLDLAESPRGPKRYYGFDDDEDYAAKVPWAEEMLRDAKARDARQSALRAR